MVTLAAASDEFRHAMRRLATTIAVVTAGANDGWVGMAATAVMSVCAEPPTLVVAVNRSASVHATLSNEPYFCVNLLADRHQGLVAIFGGQKKGRERFETGAWAEGPMGVPVLEDALASLVCRKTRAIDIGSHTLFIGEAERIVNHADIAPLLWVDGGFASTVRRM